MDTCDCTSRSSFFEIRQRSAIPRIAPCFSSIFTDLNSCPVMTAGTRITGLNQPSLTCANRTSYYLMTFGMFGSYQFRSAP